MNNIFKNLPVRIRFILVFGIVILLNLVNLFMTFNDLSTLHQISKDLYSFHFVGMNRLIEADRDAYQSRLAISESFSATNRNNINSYEKLEADINSNLEQINTRYSEFYGLYTQAVEDASVSIDNNVRANYEKLKTTTAEITNLLKQQQVDQAESIYYSSYIPAFEVMREAMNQFTDLFLAATEKEHNITQLAGRKIFISTMVVFVLILTVVIAGAFLLTKSITKPLSDVVLATEKIASGKLHFKVESDGKNEISKVLASVEKMRQELLHIITDIINASGNISSASENLSNRSQRMAQAATEQASSVEELSSAMEEMASNIHQNSDNSRQTEKIALSAAVGIKKGSSATVEAVDLMKNIADKISIINDIAFQTNILALNAAVEAARAGEYGRGFAVVAAEVRKLAERSKVAADEIQLLSRSVMNSSQEAGNQLEQLVPEIERTAKLVQEITASSLEQTSGAELVNTTIQQINQVTQQNATLAEDIATSSEELSGQAQQLIEITAYFKTAGN